jgi:hypothetical protein
MPQGQSAVSLHCLLVVGKKFMGEAAQKLNSVDFADVGNDDAIREALRVPPKTADKVSAHAPMPLRRALQDSEPYPVDAMGPLMGPAVRGASESVQAPLELCAQSALANAALAVQGHANALMPWGDGKPSPISLFLLSVAESGDRKTTADKILGGNAIATHEETLEGDVALRRLRYFNEKEAHEAARLVAKNKATKDAGGDTKAITAALNDVGEPPVPPLAATLTFGDPTIEGMHKQFASGQPSAGLFSTEGGAFVGGVGMNKDNALKSGAQFSEMWDGAPIKRVRSGDGTTVLRNRRLSFHLMMQPGAAHAWLSDPVLRDQGLFSRLLLAAPKSLAGTRLHRDPSPEATRAIAAFNRQLAEVLDHPLPLHPDKPGELTPRDLPLTSDARTMMFGFADEIERQVGEGGALAPVKGLAGKTIEHAARIAAVLGLFEDLNLQEISRPLMARGIALAQWYLGEALRLTEAEAVSPELVNAERVLDWLKVNRKDSPFSLPCIYMNGPRPVRCKETANAVVRVLLDHHWIESVEGSHKIGGVLRRECFRLRAA